MFNVLEFAAAVANFILARRLTAERNTVLGVECWEKTA
jgi:hypothetical protein